ncbi:MAG: 4-hydroxybutyrate CoA-transferase, partial [Bacteroidota bacterium]
MANFVSAQEALSVIQSGQRLFVHGVAANPQYLMDELVKYVKEKDVKDVEFLAFCPFGRTPFADAAYADNFKINSLFVSGGIRPALDEQRGSYIPVFLSEIPELFLNNILPIDVAIFHVSPPDKHGYCTLGVSIDVALSALKMAKVCIAQVNPQMPRTHGDGFVHVSQFKYMVEADEALPEVPVGEPSETEMTIGKYCAEL